MSEIHYEWNQLEEAQKEVHQGLELLEAWGDADRIIIGLLTGVRIYSCLGDDQRSFLMIKKARDFSGESPYWLERIEAYEDWLLVKNQKMAGVNSWIKKYNALFKKEFGQNRWHVYRSLAKTLILLKKYEDADFLLEKMLPTVEASELIDQQIRTLALKVAALSGLGKAGAALETLGVALDLAKQGRYVRVFLDEGEFLIPLLYQAVQKGIHPEYCRKLLKEAEKRDSTPSQSPNKQLFVEDKALVEPLSDREIEVLEQIAEGHTNQEIAQELILSLYTVKSHARNIYSKLGVKNRTEAVARGRLLGLLPYD
jgi:LuxR family maltose regulon positive regulatory protein